MNKQRHSAWFTVLLGVLIALPALGTDMYVPAMPALAAAMGAPVSEVQFTLTAYFAGLAAGQLLWGPLSDRYGRKPVLLAGLATTLAASIAGGVVDSVVAVAGVRLAQGLGMSSGALIGRTIVRDLYEKERAARMLSSMTIIFSVVPMAAPMVGGVLAGWAGWNSVFLCMALVVALLTASVTRIAETAPDARRSVHPGEIARTFFTILADRRFYSPFLVVFCAHMAVLSWVSNSSFTLVSGFGISPVTYGLLFAVVMLGQIGGSWASSRLVLRLGIPRMLRLGALVMLVAGALVAALAWLGVRHWTAVTLPFTAVLFGTALIVPNATAAALSPFPHSAGAASSVIGAIGFTAAALVSTLLGMAFDGTARPMATAAAISGLCAFIFERLLIRGKA